jgi:hypothetical protein
MIIDAIGRALHSNPHAIWRRITGGQLKKAAEKLKKKPTHKGMQTLL